MLILSFFTLLILSPQEVILMNITFILQLIAELNIMDISGIKPNYAALARKYDMDYRTVKKYHEGYQGKPKNRNKPSKLDEYEEVIIEKLSIPRTTIRYETNPGDMAQCDWKENIRLTSKNGEVFVINIFHLVMKFSRQSYIELTLSKEQPIVFRCLINAFNFYGGIPKRILFDNMSTVVDANVKPKRINYKMMQFFKDMNFKIETCKARHAYTKGTNEARNKIMDWLRCYSNEFETLEDLQKLVDKLNVKMSINICASTDIAPCLLSKRKRIPDSFSK